MIRAPAARDTARKILESVAPATTTDTLIELAASLIMNAVETDETAVRIEALRAAVGRAPEQLEHP